MNSSARRTTSAIRARRQWTDSVTKGDLLHQEQKLAASGLGDLFAAVEIVSEKDASTYERVFARHGTGADEAVMCGNSMRSDILPACRPAPSPPTSPIR